MLPKFIKSLLRLQRIAIEILESPMSRLTDCLLALSAHTYNMFARALTEEENFDSFVTLVSISPQPNTISSSVSFIDQSAAGL